MSEGRALRVHRVNTPEPPLRPLRRMDLGYPPWEGRGLLNRFVAKVIAPRLIEWIARDDKTRNMLIDALEDRL